MPHVICFDLEGPLSPQDNAYEVMGLLPEGHKIFEVISRYDDILTLEKRPGYEPGDTLSLIVPFLVRHHITDEDVRKVSEKALIVGGVKETIKALGSLGWTPYIISTSYEQHAQMIADQIGIPRDRIYCTRLPLKKYVEESDQEGFDLVDESEKVVLEKIYPNLEDEAGMKEILDRFFWTDLPKTKLGRFMSEVKVVGGQRKVDSAKKAAEKNGLSLKDIIAVGDSITDYKMLGEVDKAGGVSVAFNANQYSIPYATVGLASTDMRMLLIIVEAFMEGGRKNAVEAVKRWEKDYAGYLADPSSIPAGFAPREVREFLEERKSQKESIAPRLHYLSGADEKKQAEVLALHKITRSAVRGAAAKLG